MVKNLPAMLRDLGSIPGSGKYPGEKHGNPLQYSYLENSHGQRSLVGYSSWGHKESDMTEKLSTAYIEARSAFKKIVSTWELLKWGKFILL